MDLCVANLTLTHVDLNGREISKPFGGSEKVRSASSFTLNSLEEASVFSVQTTTFNFLVCYFKLFLIFKYWTTFWEKLGFKIDGNFLEKTLPHKLLFIFSAIQTTKLPSMDKPDWDFDPLRAQSRTPQSNSRLRYDDDVIRWTTTVWLWT